MSAPSVDEATKIAARIEGPHCVRIGVTRRRAHGVRRHLPNVALFHYADYQADLAGELLRLARVLGIAATRDRARDLAQYATLDAMRSRASEIAPNTTDGIWHSDERFFRRGGSGDWQQFFTEAEHLRYYHRINQLAPPDLLAWAHEGRRGYDPAN